MGLKRRERPATTIEVGPFSDIAFLLIIFFVLTTTFVRPAGSELDIPAGEADKAKAQETQPTVTLTATAIAWGEKGRPVDLAELRTELLAQDFPARPEGKRVVILNAAPDVPYQRWYEVVMAIHHSGGVLAIIEEDEEGAS